MLAINKIDRVKDKRTLLPFDRAKSAARATSPRSSRSRPSGNAGRARCSSEIGERLPRAPPIYDEDEITTVPSASSPPSCVREKLFRLLGDELPYATAVEIEQLRDEGDAAPHRRRSRRQGGPEGDRHRREGRDAEAIGTQARQDMERLFGGKVFLETLGAVRSGWADERRAGRWASEPGSRRRTAMSACGATRGRTGSRRSSCTAIRIARRAWSSRPSRASSAASRWWRRARAGPRSALRGVLLPFQPLSCRGPARASCSTLESAPNGRATAARRARRSSAAST